MNTDSADDTLDSFISQWDAKLVARIRQRVPDARIAAEIAQEVWIAIYQREGDGPVPDNLVPLMFGIAKNKVADWYRANVPKSAVPLAPLLAEFAEPPAPEAGPGESLRGLPDHMQEAFHELKRILPRLTRLERDAVIYRHYVGMSVAEVATAMDVKHHAVKRFLTRGLRKIRTLLRQAGYTISVSTREMP